MLQPAGYAVGIAQGNLGGVLLPADFHAVLAAGSEGAALQGQKQIGGSTLQGVEFLLVLSGQSGHRAQQSPGVGMLGILEDLLSGARSTT